MTGRAVARAGVGPGILPTTVGLCAILWAAGPAMALPVIPGDINDDGKLNVSDVQCHVLASANPDSPPDCMKVSYEDADVSCDGAVNVSDLQMVVLLAVGNPLSLAVDPDGDDRVGACDPDQDGDSWSDECESAAGTDPSDPDLYPSSAAECAEAPLSTACRLSGTAGETARCDLRLARRAGTVAANALDLIIQVDPATATLEQIDTARTCVGGTCTYGGSAPPVQSVASGAGLGLSPGCTTAPCTQPWALGKLGVAVGVDDGSPLTHATWSSPGVALSGDGFLVSVSLRLVVDATDVAVEAFGSGGRAGQASFAAPLLSTDDGAALVSDGPPGGGVCVSSSECDDGDPCTDDLCVAGVCDAAPVTCDDGLSCTTDTCTAQGCAVALVEGYCVVGGSCQALPNAACDPQVRLSEVVPEGDEAWIEVVHEGPAIVRLDGYALSTGAAPWALTPVTLTPFGTARVWLGDGTDTGTDIHAGGQLDTLSWTGGEVVLWRDGAMVDYVAWGPEGHPTMVTAGASGHWSHGASLVVDAVPPGYSLQSNANEGATAWNAAAQTANAGTIPCALTACIEVACHEGEDGDQDGQVDCDDADCVTATGCEPGAVELCGDGEDNDNNGFADCLDPACALGESCPSRPTLNEILIADGGDSTIELTNLDVSPIPVDALFLCTEVSCVQVPGGGWLYPASFLRVHTGTGQDTVTDRWLQGALGDLSSEAGELALSSSVTTTSGSLWSYLRWSDSSNPTPAEGSLDGLAADAGVWAPGTRLYTAAYQPTDSLARDPVGSGMAWEWDIHTQPSAGQGNPNCGSAGQCRETRCADDTDEDGDGGFDCGDGDCDQWPTCHVRVVFSEVRFEGESDAIEVANLGTSVASMFGRTIQDGAQSFSLSQASELAPGEVLVVRAGEGVDGEDLLFGLTIDLQSAGGELVLERNGVDDYVRWGTGDATREADAVAAGQWLSDEAVDVSGMSLTAQTLSYDGWGDRASDWTVSEATIGVLQPIEFGNCGDATDNDQDTLTDCWDDDCESDALCAGEHCGNAIDDDGDGDTDCADADCANQGACIENGHCDDGIDNDLDGMTDCHDTDDCSDSEVCDEAFHCTDGVDNDLNGFTDCEDEACTGSQACIEAGNCTDGIDNDGNGLTDCAEQTACGVEESCQEPINCADGIDNDVDGLTDCEDTSDCEGQVGCIESICDDLLDDDDDGLVDCDDDECALLPVCVGANAQFALTELYLDSSAETHVIELSNIGAATGDAGGLVLCGAGDCFTIPADTEVTPGAFLVLETGPDDDFDGHRFTGTSLTGLSSDDGALAIYATYPAQGPGDILDFVQWGNPGHPDEALAAAAGQWIAGEAIPSAGYQGALTSYIWLGTGEGAAHWAVHSAPSPGEPNPDCGQPGVCAELVCDDGVDGDEDGPVDCQDADCFLATTCQFEGAHCNDTLDNDGDGFVDCQDTADCQFAPLCDESLQCADLVDNDWDGATDCEDSACDGHPVCNEALNCADQKDNDADGLYDCEDSDCTASAACTETDTECEDAYDNDHDGAVDCDDSDCAGSPACLEVGQCWDGIDNDTNGLTDCADSACNLSQACAPRARITEVSFDGDGHGTVEIGNPGVGEVAVAQFWVCVDSTCSKLPEHVAPIGAAGTLGFHSGSGDVVYGHFYLEAPWGLDPTAGSARLYGASTPAGAPTLLLDYVAWGAPGQIGESEAVSAGRWPAGAAVPTTALSVGRSLGRYGVTHEPWRWAVWHTPSVTDGGQLACHDTLCHETWCGDGRDNDGDGITDCDDPDCDDQAPCLEAGQCDDAKDNDANGAVDCYDAGCAGDAQCGSAARFGEVALDQASGGDTIELFNPFQVSLSLGGTRLCSTPTTCYNLPDGVTLSGGERLSIHAGAGTGPAGSLEAGDALGDLTPTGGELALTDGGSPEDADAILAYVDWGHQGGSMHHAAAAAGVWRLGDRVETAQYNSGTDSLISDGSAPHAGAWSLATTATPGGANPDCATPENCRENRCFDGLDDDGDNTVDCNDSDCALVMGCVGRIVLNELHFGDGTPDNRSWFEITNRGLDTVDIEGWQVCTGEACYTIGEGELDPGDFLVFMQGPGSDTDNTVYTDDALVSWASEGGSLSLYGVGGLHTVENTKDYVRWGSGVTTGEAMAVSAGQWLPGDALETGGLTAQESLHYGGSGDGAFAWTIAVTPSQATTNQPCATPGNCRELDCADGRDEDSDALTDCADPDCGYINACDESAHCANGLDDDNDGDYDCQDLACSTSTACVEALACEDIGDNDLDGFVDCEDVECAAKPHCDESQLCADGLDNNVNGVIDCADLSCSGSPDCPESDHCDDLIDNDLDGLFDCADDDCFGSSVCLEGLNCDDDVDNDLDGMTDCSDDACAGLGVCATGIECPTEGIIQAACGEITGDLVDSNVLFNPSGTCGFDGADDTAIFEVVAPCTGQMGIGLVTDAGDEMHILRLDGYCNTASSCGGGIQDEVAGTCAYAGNFVECTQMFFSAVAGGHYFFLVQRSEESTGSGDATFVFYCLDCAEADCADGIDNDMDDLLDCEDPDCGCNEAAACDNSVDDDGDGATDCADDECADNPHCDESTACQDGVDQDVDGLVDCDDPDCPHYLLGDQEGFCAASEGTDAPFTSGSACSDGIDNDGDVLVDCDDSDCATSEVCTEIGRCDDNLDNNADGATDCSDSSCATDPLCAGGVTCAHHDVLTCGSTVTHDPAVAGTDVLGDNYCGHMGQHTGSKEVIYQLESPCEGMLRATLSHESEGTYTLSALESICQSTAWCGAPPRVVESTGDAVTLEWPGHPGVDTYLVVEGHAGTTGAYTLNVACVGCPETGCGDGIDDDGDGQIDCSDSDCASVSPCSEELTCDDGVDEDLDGQTDCDDTDCAGIGDCHYACAPTDLPCGTITTLDLGAGTGLTNIIDTYSCATHDYDGAEEAFRVQVPGACDATVSAERLTGDGRIDLLVLGANAPECSPETCSAVGEMNAAGQAQVTLAQAAPGQHHLVAMDGRAGFVGQARVAVSCCSSPVEDFCGDGVDGDGDGDTDCEDSDCASLATCLPESNCLNNADDDNDGATDCADPDCALSPACSELDCGDGVDSDNDGQTDCDDTDCANTIPCTIPCAAYQTLTCGDAVINATTDGGLSLFGGYACASEASCDGGGHPGPEQSYVVVPPCNTDVTVVVNYASGYEDFFAAYLGPSCDETLQSCGGNCTDPNSASGGTASSPAQLSFEAQAGKAHWFNVESEAEAGTQGTTFSLAIQCSCP